MSGASLVSTSWEGGTLVEEAWSEAFWRMAETWVRARVKTGMVIS